jgi:hypothetical protein
VLTTEPLHRDDVRAIRWNVHSPTYRVDFWHQYPPPPGGQAAKMGFKQDAHRVSGADSVSDVVAWAQENASGRSFVIYVELTYGGEPGILRVHGVDPTAPARSNDA